MKCKKAEEDKRALSSQIHILSQEVESGKLLIDKLLKTTNDSTKAFDWERKEKEYISAIRNIRQQIRAQASVVSLDLYKASVDENKVVKLKLQRAEKRVACLENKLEIKANSTLALGSTTFNSKSSPKMGNKTLSDISKKSNMPSMIDAGDGLQWQSSEQKKCSSSPRGDSRIHQEKKIRPHKRNDDLTGMTIHCQISPGSLGTTFHDASQADTGAKTEFEKRQFKSSCFNENQGPENKENSIGQTSASLTMQKARKFGGRRGLQLRLNKIRSPLPVKERALKSR